MNAEPPYALFIKRSAEKELNQLPARIRQRVSDVILSLAETPRPRGCRKLGGLDYYRIRISNYRLLYTVDDSQREIDIIAVRHRRDVYKGL